MPFWIPEPIGSDRYRLHASDDAVVGIPGRQAVLGGVTSGAAVAAAEQMTGMSLIAASTQFLAPALPGREFELDVTVLSASKRTAQARVTCRDGDTVVLTTQATLGSPDATEQSYVEAPDVPPPDRCEQITAPKTDVLAQFERRTAWTDEAAGRQATWFRCERAVATDAAYLSVIADFLAGAHTDVRGSINLDCTLRIVQLEPSTWVLADTRILAIGERRYAGSMTLHSASGALLASVSQTGQRPRAATTDNHS